MPKFGSHIIFAELAKEKRPDLFIHGYDNAFRLGAIGPDTTLFMFDPATDKPELRKGITAILNVLESIEDIKKTVGDIVSKISEPVDDIKDWLSGGLVPDLSYTVNAGIDIMMLSLKLGVATGSGSINVKNPIFSKIASLPEDFIKDPKKTAEYWTVSGADQFGFPFRMFGHPYTSDGTWKLPLPTGDYSEWWWMDLLHYRKTGIYAKKLLENAEGPVGRAYAEGYMTHVAGDISGHPFINELVRGPFRNHAYRHLVVETIADTWLWDHQNRGDVLGARFDKLIDLNDEEEEEISRLVVRTMQDVYKDPMVPRLLKNGYPTQDEWLSGYKLMQQYLRLSTSPTIERPTAPPENIKEVFKEIQALLRNNIPGQFPNPGGGIEDFLKALFSWFAKGLTLLTMLATLDVAVITRLLTKAPRWIIYLLNLALYFMISALRTIICLTGWGYCGKDDFSSFGFLEDMVTTKNNNEDYPRETLPDNRKPPFYWLLSPDHEANLEDISTRSMLPFGRRFKPDIMIDEKNTLDLDLATRILSAKSPEETRSLAFSFEEQSVFGNAVDFSIALLDGTLPVPDLDLDGDRGYGYKGWEKLPPNEKYV